jgi:glycosyltransferase involved in cell wall biosynthesis
MTVAVLLPVYNGAETLPAAIESILAQTHSDLELIVIDDASTDDSAAVIRAYARDDGRVRPVYHEQNEGLAATLNQGLELTDAEFVARLDQDDESLPERLATQLEFMADHPNVAAAGSFVYHMGRKPKWDRLVEFPTDPLGIRTTLRRENCLYHPSVMLRREHILALGGYRAEFKNAEDYDLWLRTSRRYDLGNVPVPLIRYRFSVDGMTLGRKWEQLYYVYLAQASAARGDDDLLGAAAAVDVRLHATDRRAFFIQVSKGTLYELLLLRRFAEAVTVGRRLSSEVGKRTTAKILLRGFGSVLRRSTPGP